MQPGENKQLIDSLIIDYLKGGLDAIQTNELITWIKQDISNKRYFDELAEIWITSNALNGNTKYNPIDGFNNFKSKISAETSENVSLWRNTRFLIRVAAVFIGAFLLGGVLFYNIGKRSGRLPSDSAYEIVVPRGAKASFVLADGTRVTLNAGSKLKYYADYGVKDRTVQLEGEGYFKVAKDKTRPFIVTTSHVNVRALGTEFDVKAYASDKTIETTLVEGSVKIENRDPNMASEPIILKPNQRLTFYKENATFKERSTLADKSKEEMKQMAKSPKLAPIHRLVAENVNVQPVISWKEKRWIIEKQTLAQLAIDFERRYDIDIHFDSERLKKFRFTGTLMDESLEQVLSVMTITAPISYSIKGKNVVFTEKEGFEEIYLKLYNDN